MLTDKEIIDSIFNKEPEHKRLYTLEYSLGDRCYDGHGRYEEHFAKSNYSSEEISKAYKSATELLGFDYVKEIAAEYMDSSISCKYTGKLLKHGILTPSDFGYSEEEWKEYIDSISENGSFDYEYLNEYLNEDFYDLDQDKFVDIFVKIIKLILPDFELIEVTVPTDGCLNELDNTAYGLFY